MDSKSQLGAYKSLDNAKKDWKEGYTIYDRNGKAVYPVVSVKTKADLTGDITLQLPQISKGCTGTAVKMLQVMLGVEADGSFGDATEKAFRTFQGNTGQTADGICGPNGWKADVYKRQAVYTWTPVP